MPEVQETATGFATDVDISAPTQLDPPPASAQQPGTDSGAQQSKGFMDYVPEAYRSKDWVSNLSKTENPFGEMFKQFDNQISLIGRKNEGLRVPGEGATPEDWSNFHKAIGVPETPDKYEYVAPQVDEKLKPYFATDDNLINTMKEAALRAGVRPEGFKHLTEAFDKYYVAELQKSVEGFNQTMAKLENDFKAKFGDQSNQVLDSWNRSFSGLSAEQQALVKNLDPSIKVVLAEQYHNFSKKYVREGNLNLEMPAENGGMTQAQYGDEYGKRFAALNKAHPGSPEYVEAKRALDNLRSMGEQIFKK